MEALFITTPSGQKIRVLTPNDTDLIESALEKPSPADSTAEKIAKEEARIVFRIMFYLGLRYVEARRLRDHPEWVLWERSQVWLPREASRKLKRVFPERYIPFVSNQLGTDIRQFLKIPRLLDKSNWRNRLRRSADVAGLGTDGITPKMTRVSIECWMLAINIPQNKICLRQGHDSLTALKNYSAIPFSPEEIEEIRKRLVGW